MPRQARLDIPAALHHIKGRGINQFPIFIWNNKTMRRFAALGKKLRG